jgi:hypothetical protein
MFMSHFSFPLNLVGWFQSTILIRTLSCFYSVKVNLVHISTYFVQVFSNFSVVRLNAEKVSWHPERFRGIVLAINLCRQVKSLYLTKHHAMKKD